MVAGVVGSDSHMIASDGARSSTISVQNRSVIARSPARPFFSAALAGSSTGRGRGRSCRTSGRPSRARPGPGNRPRRARRWRRRSRSRHASAAARRGSARAIVRPVARRIRSGKSGGPAERQTRPSPSSSAIVLPRRPCRAGRQPVAIEAALARVVDGKTLRCAAKRAPRSPSSTQERRVLRPDQIGAQAVADHDDDARFPFMARLPLDARIIDSDAVQGESKISKLRSRCDCAIAR